MSKYLDADLIKAVDTIKAYLEENAPGGSLRLMGDQGTLVLLTQDPPVIDALNDAFDEQTEYGDWDDLVPVNVKEPGEC
jgi:hypothetical protein